MNEPITTDEQLDALPLASVVVDRDGDTWMVLGRGLLGGTEIQATPADDVLKKWGPLALRWTPGDSPPLHPTRVLPTEAEVAQVLRDAYDPPHLNGLPPVAADRAAARAVLAMFASQPTVAQVKAEAVREAVKAIRGAWNGSWNLRSPEDPEAAYSVDVWLSKYADRIEREG